MGVWIESCMRSCGAERRIRRGTGVSHSSCLYWKDTIEPCSHKNCDGAVMTSGVCWKFSFSAAAIGLSTQVEACQFNQG